MGPSSIGPIMCLQSYHVNIGLQVKTRQVYNLFQDLWNKAMVFLERCQKKVYLLGYVEDGRCSLMTLARSKL